MGNNLTILPSPDDDLGPRMAACTELQRRFVRAWFQYGNRRKAAIAAGYSAPNENTIDATAFNAWNSPRVQAAVREYAEKHVLMGLLPLAFAAIEDIASDPDHKDRLKAADMIWQRTGFHAKSEHLVTVDHNDGRVGQIKKLIALAETLGKSPRELLGAASDVVDADFEILDTLTVERGKEGLEDLL